MDQGKKPAAPTEAERKEKVRAVLAAAGAPLEPGEIAERIGEGWCTWNGTGFGSAITPVLRRMGAKRQRGKWMLRPDEGADDGQCGPIGSDDPIPHQVMRRDRWEGRHESPAMQQK